MNIHAAIGICNLCIVYILIKNIACKSCWCVLVFSIGLIFCQVRVRSESGTVFIVVRVYPLVPGYAIE